MGVTFPKTGTATYGESIGIIMQHTEYPRIPGDIGNAWTFPFPVRYQDIGYIPKDAIMTKRPAKWIYPVFVDAAKELELAGVRAIVGACGYDLWVQDAVANAVDVPVFMSSLLLVPFISRTLKQGRIVGILTADAEDMTTEFLALAGIDDTIPHSILGLEHIAQEGEFWVPETELDPIARRTHIERCLAVGARTWVEREPAIGAIVFECTNMPPAAKAVQDVTGVPVYDITTVVQLAYITSVRTRFKTGHEYM